jgi:hypothetical protein
MSSTRHRGVYLLSFCPKQGVVAHNEPGQAVYHIKQIRILPHCRGSAGGRGAKAVSAPPPPPPGHVARAITQLRSNGPRRWMRFFAVNLISRGEKVVDVTFEVQMSFRRLKRVCALRHIASNSMRRREKLPPRPSEKFAAASPAHSDKLICINGHVSGGNEWRRQLK